MCGRGCMAFEWQLRPYRRCSAVEKNVQGYPDLQGPHVCRKIRGFAKSGQKKVQYMMSRGEHLSLNRASVILAELLGVLLGLRRSEHFASAERSPNTTTLLCFRNLAGANWDLGDCTKTHDIKKWANELSMNEIIRIRLCYTKHQRHRVAHEVIAGPGYRHMSLVP